MSPDSPISKPDCKCGHLYMLHAPRCMKCGCFPYTSEDDLTLTDIVEADKVHINKDVKKKEIIPHLPENTIEMQCPTCGEVEVFSMFLSTPLHRHDQTLVRMLSYDKGIDKPAV